MKNLFVGVIVGVAMGFALGQFFGIVRNDEPEREERDAAMNRLTFESLLCRQAGDYN